MNDIDRALSQLSEIRSRFAASTRFRGFAPEAVGLIGCAGLLILACQILWPERFAASDRQIVLIWGGLLLTGGFAVAAEAVGRSQRSHGGMADAMLQGAGRAVLPIAGTGAVIASVVLAYAPEAAWLLPGTWQMLLGLVVFASYAMMPRAILWPAVWYLGSGAAVLVLSGQRQALSPVAVGLPLVVGHFAIAAILWSKEDEPHGR